MNNENFEMDEEELRIHFLNDLNIKSEYAKPLIEAREKLHSGLMLNNKIIVTVQKEDGTDIDIQVEKTNNEQTTYKKLERGSAP